MFEAEKTDFQKEQDTILKTILDNRFFQYWKDEEIDKGTSLRQDSSLELFLTNTCNQNCEYCYLKKYPALYPSSINNSETILANLEKIYNYILKNNWNIPQGDFFSGEIWHTQFGLDVLELTLKYIKKGMKVGWWIVASNCSFVMNPIQTQKIQGYINEFAKFGSPLTFSISVEGKILESESRALVSGEQKDDLYWDELFSFAKHNNFYFHPMVSSNNVQKWIENHKWFEEKFNQYDMDINALMMLEVRNADWSELSIKEYNAFMQYLISRFLEKDCNNSIKKFTEKLFCFRLKNQEKGLSGYIPFGFPKADDFIGCTCANSLAIRVGDLSIIPCHRLAYNKYLYGNFITDENGIKDIKSNNPQMAIKILMTNFNEGSLGCDTCIFKDYCLKGCLGSQYESMGDPFVPSKNVCNFFKEKYSFLLNTYEKMGVINYLKEVSPLEIDYPEISLFLKFFKKWKEEGGN